MLVYKMLARSGRLFLGEFRGPGLTLGLPGSCKRCLSVGGSLGRSEGPQQGDNSASSKSSSGLGRVGLGAAVVAASGLCLAWYTRGREKRRSQWHETSIQAPLLQLNASGGGEKAPGKVSVRERRYKDFSSIRYRGEPYMTPRDFLESITIDEPRRECSTCG